MPRWGGVRPGRDGVPALRGFVTCLGQDLDAVVAGLSLRCISGAREGPRPEGQGTSQSQG